MTIAGNNSSDVGSVSVSIGGGRISRNEALVVNDARSRTTARDIAIGANAAVDDGNANSAAVLPWAGIGRIFCYGVEVPRRGSSAQLMVKRDVRNIVHVFQSRQRACRHMKRSAFQSSAKIMLELAAKILDFAELISGWCCL